MDPVSHLISPVGPEPRAVYWIRRAAILVIVITLVFGAWWLVSSLRGGGSADPAPGASASQSEGTDEITDEGQAEASEGTDAAASPDASPAAATTECLDSAIKVVATTDASTYPVGSTPKLTLTITNIGDVACKRDVGPKANELEITSGGYHVWSSDDCNASGKSKVMTLKPDETVASSITWDGRLSAKGCPDPEGDQAKAGRYDLVGRNGEVVSKTEPFALTNKG